MLCTIILAPLTKCTSGQTVNLAKVEPWEIIRLRNKEIGYVSQFFSVIPRVSALDILTSTQTARGVAQGEARERAAEYLEKVGISPSLWDMYPATFSGGEKQRLNIANALIKEWVMDLILALKAEGTAMVGVFHDEIAIRTLADHRFEMQSKQMVPVDQEKDYVDEEWFEVYANG